MARKSKKTPQRRRSSGAINLLNVAEGLVQANIVTSSIFGADLNDFIRGTTDGVYKPGADGSRKLTLPELLGAGPGGIGGRFAAGHTLSSVLQDNFSDNWMPGLTKMVYTKVAFKVGKKATSSLRRQVNSGLKQLGMSSMVRV